MPRSAGGSVRGRSSGRLRKAALPLAAAVGGMLAPAILFATLNAGRDGSAAWAVPMATDIAFAIRTLTLLGSRAHQRGAPGGGFAGRTAHPCIASMGGVRRHAGVRARERGGRDWRCQAVG
jgi:hypothetical protein